MRERGVRVRCNCGTQIEGESDMCSECTRQRYEEVWSHRVSNEFSAWKSLLYGSILLLISCIPAYASQEINLRAMCQIESGCRADAVGDGGKALGMFQIHKAVVEDWNNRADISGDDYYTHNEMLDPKKSEIVARWYLNEQIPAYLRILLRTNKPITLEQTLTAYNMGVGAVVKGKVASTYIKRYKEALRGIS